MTLAREERWAAAAAHLSAFAVALAVGLAFAGGASALIGILVAPAGPLVVAALSRRSGLFLRGHVREALRFCLSVAFYATGVALSLAAAVRYEALAELYPLLLFVAIFLVFIWLSLLVIATKRAVQGQEWRYPFTMGPRRRARAS